MIQQNLSSSSFIHDLNLKVLQKKDDAITCLLDSSVYVAVYLWDLVTQSWTRKGVEGTLFIYER
jgi:hypothetical protein